MYGHYILLLLNSRVVMDQPGNVANPARGRLNRENELFTVVPVRA